MPVAPIEDVIRAMQRGEMVILVDDEDRENEGDLCMPAEQVTPEAINFMARFGRGLICLGMTRERLQQLEIPMMVDKNTSRLGTAFTVSIEASSGVTTGISAADRAHTVQVAVNDASKPRDLARPGHVFPLAARAGGVLARTGQTEGGVDLARLSGFKPASVICEIMKDDGTMARMPDLELFAAEHGLLICTIADLIKYRLSSDSLVEKLAQHPFPTVFHDDFIVHVFRSLIDGSEHLLLTLGDVATDEPVLVRAHAQCTIGDVFGALAVDDGFQLHRATAMIAEEGRGALLYIGRPDRGFSWEVEQLLTAKSLEPEPTTDEVLNSPPPELRQFGVGAQCLRAVGIRKMKLLTNNPSKIVGLKAHGLEIVGRAPLLVAETTANAAYLQRKRENDHILNDPEGDTTL